MTNGEEECATNRNQRRQLLQAVDVRRSTRRAGAPSYEDKGSDCSENEAFDDDYSYNDYNNDTSRSGVPYVSVLT